MMQKLITSMKKGEGFVAVEVVIIGAALIVLASWVAISALNSGKGTSEAVTTTLSHDASFINEATKNELIQ